MQSNSTKVSFFAVRPHFHGDEASLSVAITRSFEDITLHLATIESDSKIFAAYRLVENDVLLIYTDVTKFCNSVLHFLGGDDEVMNHRKPGCLFCFLPCTVSISIDAATSHFTFDIGLVRTANVAFKSPDDVFKPVSDDLKGHVKDLHERFASVRYHSTLRPLTTAFHSDRHSRRHSVSDT
jgi:hypothetical protein